MNTIAALEAFTVLLLSMTLKQIFTRMLCDRNLVARLDSFLSLISHIQFISKSCQLQLQNVSSHFLPRLFPASQSKSLPSLTWTVVMVSVFGKGTCNTTVQDPNGRTTQCSLSPLLFCIPLELGSFSFHPRNGLELYICNFREER